MENKIICGKFDSCIKINLNKLNKEKVRIGSTNPNQLKSNKYTPIATDGESIIYESKKYAAREFLINKDISILKNLLVLTIKERELLLEALVDMNLDVSIFEIKYPIFKHIKYISNIHKNYAELKKLLEIVDNLNIRGKSLAHQLSTEYLYKIERKLRFKNKLDSFFAFAYKGGYQEVFKLKEERANRSIIALDFNSMYVSCMMDNFLEPKSIQYIDLRNSLSNIKSLENGLYHVILKKPRDTFFKNTHPFKYVNLNHSYYFKLEAGQEIQLLLFKNEIEYYMQYFEDIEILEGFYSKKTIQHPLKKFALDTYKDRFRYKKKQDDILSDYCKFRLITIHSSTNPKKFKTIYFSTLDEIVKYLSDHYMICFPTNMSNIQKLASIQDDAFFKFWVNKNGYKVRIADFNNYGSVYSISSQIIANARLKMVQTIKRFLKHNSVEICYTNIDSIHISILTKEVSNFLTSNGDIISDKLGHLKIEAIADKGYWFDVGRYWLIKDGNTALFKNIIFNTKNKTDEFIRNKKINILCKNPIFNYTKTAWLSIYNTFQYHKKVNYSNLDNWDYTRYTFNEIKNLNVANISYTKEILRSKQSKIDLFKNIATA